MEYLIVIKINKIINYTKTLTTQKKNVQSQINNNSNNLTKQTQTLILYRQEHPSTNTSTSSIQHRPGVGGAVVTLHSPSTITSHHTRCDLVSVPHRSTVCDVGVLVLLCSPCVLVSVQGHLM